MSYAPASPDRSSFYGGATSTQTTSTTATQIGRTRPLATSAPSGFSLPVSPTPTIHHQPYTHHYSHQQYQLELSPQHHQRREYIAAQFPPNPSLSHLDAHHQPAYSPKSPVSPPPYSTHHAPHPQQALTHFNPHSPQSPQPPRAPQQSAPLDFNAAHVASPVQIQFHSSYGTPGQPQGQLYQLESPQTHPTIYAAPQQNFAQQLGGPIPTGHSQRLEPPPHIKSENDYHHHAQVAPREQITMPPRRSTAAAVQPPPIDPSPVKTKFPTARIKRIMQADEEVGKVAQQTPIAVGKALEMFMIALVSKSHDIAKDKGAKRVTAQHLKQVVESDDQWDFLREIVGRVSETEDKSKAGRAKAESSSDEEQQVEVKKKGRGGRKKKTA